VCIEFCSLYFVFTTYCSHLFAYTFHCCTYLCYMPLNTSYLLTYVAEVCGEEFNQLERADDRRRGFAAAEAGLVSTSQQTGHCCVAGAVFCCRRLACSVHTPTYPPPTPTQTHTHTHADNRRPRSSPPPSWSLRSAPGIAARRFDR